MFTIILGIWSLTENGIMAVLVENRAASTFLSYVALALIGVPLCMFVRYYLQTDDKYVYKIVVMMNTVDIAAMFLLQFLGVRDMKQILWIIHIPLVAALLYLPFSLIRMLYRHHINRRFWVAVVSLLCMCFPLVSSLYLYYCGSYIVDSYGNFSVFIFVAVFAIDVSRSIVKELEEGKKAAIYKELAESDQLTGCYNRNAYHNDTDHWEDLENVLLVTCDLNNLKQCNDTLGHAYGDRYIIDSAVILKKIFSKYGKVYRIGGDEFCIIIPESSSCSIRELHAALIEEERNYNKTSDRINLQIAFGFAEYDQKTDQTMEDIRIRADERMYADKKELKRQKAS
jgi:diguanylate cyclase (GGDEF)-like protein